MIEENQELNGEGLSQNPANQNEEVKESAVDSNIEETEEEDTEDEEQEDDHDDSQIQNVSLDELSLVDLFARAKETLMHSPKVALKQLSNIRPIFFEKFQDEKKHALEEFLEKEENKPEDFVFEHEKIADELNEILVKAKDASKEEKQRIKEEQQKNYNRKIELLDLLTKILEEDETENSISQVKDIQKEWKSIRVLPKDQVQALWDKFHMLLDKFYDNHSINIELKELDRKKNLEQKIELTKAVDELSKEKSLKKSFIMLNKLHEDFKNIGPVPQESREGIWQAFKAASDKIYDLKKKEFEDKEAEREENFKQKELLVEKASLVASLIYLATKEWNAKTKEIEAIFEEWKKIGPVPRAKSDDIWAKFKAERNKFYANRKAYFGEEYKQRKANLILKEDLCKRVESIKDNEDFINTKKEILQIQKKWKEIGQVPDKNNQAIWGRFREACDYFFNRQHEHFKVQKDQEAKNLKIKQGLIQELEALQESTDEKSIFDKLKEINNTWRSTGFIPKKDLKKTNSTYEKLVDDLYKKFKKKKGELKASQMEDHYGQIFDSPNGDKRLSSEEFKVKKRISFLNEEILNLERNLSFFAKSKNADKMLQEFESKLNKNKAQIDRLKEELKIIRGVKRSQELAEKQDDKASQE